MSKQEKLTEKLKSRSKSFTFDDAETLLLSMGYKRSDKGRSSGSRIMFVRDTNGVKIILHKPHPQKELKEYQMKQLVDHLKQEGLL